MTEKKTLQDVRDSVDRMIAERGADYVYKSPYPNEDCLYVHYRGTGKDIAGCGVGWVINDLFGELVPRGIEGSSPSICANYWTNRFHEEAIAYLFHFQESQDLRIVYQQCAWNAERTVGVGA